MGNRQITVERIVLIAPLLKRFEANDIIIHSLFNQIANCHHEDEAFHLICSALEILAHKNEIYFSELLKLRSQISVIQINEPSSP